MAQPLHFPARMTRPIDATNADRELEFQMKTRTLLETAIELDISIVDLVVAASECSDKYPCNEDYSTWESRISVPAGFEAAVISRVEDFPTSITFGPGGKLFVAGHSGTIYEVYAAGQVSSASLWFRAWFLYPARRQA